MRARSSASTARCHVYVLTSCERHSLKQDAECIFVFQHQLSAPTTTRACTQRTARRTSGGIHCCVWQFNLLIWFDVDADADAGGGIDAGVGVGVDVGVDVCVKRAAWNQQRTS